MSYHIYTTKGLVLSERPLGEADRVYNILTRDLGLIRATALGVRKVESKLRGALEPVSLSSISLVRGKEYWRVTSAEVIKRIPATLDVAGPLALLEKLVQGEVSQPELFDTVEKHLNAGEIVLVSQVMHSLGYLKAEDLALGKIALIRAINQGLKHSHLV